MATEDSLITTQLLTPYPTVSAPFLAAFFSSCSLNKELKFLFRIIISLWPFHSNPFSEEPILLLQRLPSVVERVVAVETVAR